jgi:hypothetical protein
MLSEVKRTLVDVLRDLAAMIGTAASIDAQNRRLRWGMGTGFVLGCLVWSILPGVVAHVAPTGWHWPERIAARTLREPTLWKAGEHLMRADDEKSWDELMSAADVWRGNRDIIMGCRKVANAGRTARCVIRVKA